MKHIFLIAGVFLSFGSGWYFNDLRWEIYLNQVKKEHARYINEQKDKINETQKIYDALLLAHIETITQVSLDLKEKEKEYEASLDRISADASFRMQQHENRVRIYQRQAKAGSAEAERLASHAAELDRSINEGKTVAAELAATVRLRDQQLSLLGSQIKADRAVIESTE